MSKTSFSLLAAALLGVVTAPAATAATPPEATAAAYVFTDGTATEGLTAENADIAAPLLASGYTAAHPGWDIRLSDETYAPADMRVQDYRAKASHTGTGAGASTSGFVSLVDGGSVPFAVVRPHSRSVSCTVDGPLFTGGGGGYGVWVRGASGALELVDVDATGVTTAVPAGQAGGAHVPTTVKVNRYSVVGQLSGYSAFAKYDGRAKAGTLGWELEITQGAQTYRVLVGAVAASC
ncbi:hypothetical protein [Lentzea sp. NEAU-D7]|uniref:hypothetical protein n=1 Tax=Lentzea sp. NEAU-D7 TaxID=2994667 RepID=UPI00224A4A3B|nr:hypothetical protein [Lentzea sp. NEAU-D7]MCX2949555.1 hypothetical protein [Lentzea sp. NEAU-D7]